MIQLNYLACKPISISTDNGNVWIERWIFQTVNQSLILEINFSVLNGVVSLQETGSVGALVHHTTHFLVRRCRKTEQDQAGGVVQ